MQYAGGIAGYVAGNNAKITNCRNTGQLELPEAGAYFGGIAGYITGTGAAVTGCSNEGAITGTGDYLGGIAGGAGAGSDITIDGCFNASTGTVSNGGKAQTGGILGGFVSGNAVVRNCYNQGAVAGGAGGTSVGGIAGSVAAGTRVAGCYNAGTVTGAGSGGTVKSIVGSNAGSGNITHCYYLAGNSYPLESYPADDNAAGKDESVFGTWGAAFALNGEKLEQSTGISWTWTAGDSYPQLSAAALDSAQSWEDVGRAVDDGFLGSIPNGSPYRLEHAEQLAWLAYQVNRGSGAEGTSAYLTADIDMRAKEASYVSSGHLSWVPIGKNASTAYTGVFQSYADGDDRAIFEIKNLYTESSGPAGVFGVLSGNGKVTRVGVTGCTVTGTAAGGTGMAMAGGIAGQLAGNAGITQCYNRNGSTVTADGTTAYAGGIVGQMSDSTKVMDCYHLDSTVSGRGTTTYAGGIAGDGGSSGEIQNCYNACGTTASSATIKIYGTGAAGSIAGTGGTVSQCYSEALMNGSDSAVLLDSSSNEKIWEQIDGINTANGSERTGEDRVWFTSLAAEPTRGLPTFTAPVMLAVTLKPAESDSGTTENLGAAIAGAVLRGIRPGKSNTVPFTLTAADTVSGGFHTYGSDSANDKLGLKADDTDLGTLPQSLTNAAGNAGSIGDFSQLTLYTGAAYTLASDRFLVVDVSSSAGKRYEIQVKIPKVTGKTLSVELTKKVTIDLKPDGEFHTSESGDAQIKNLGSCPLEGGVASVKAVKEEGYQELTPVKSIGELDGNKWITDSSGGVRIGIKGAPGSPDGMFPADGLYYNPASPAAWMNCRVKGGGTLIYRYCMDYTAYFNFWESRYGFEVNFQFKVAKGDFTAASGEAELIN